MKVKFRSILRLALPYILIALLPILAVIFLSTMIIHDHTQKVLQDQNALLKVATDRVETKLYAVEELASIIVDDTDLNTYIINATRGIKNDILTCQDIQNFLAHVSNDQDIVEIYFYDGIEDRIISSDTVLYESQLFFDSLYQSGSRSSDQILNELQTSIWHYQYFPAERVLLNGREENVMEYRISVPINRYKDHSQVVLVLDIDSVFQDYFDALHDGAEYCVYYADNLVYSSSDQFAELSEHPVPSTLSLIEGAERKLYGVEHRFHGSSWRVRFYYPKLAYADNRNALITTLAPAVAIPVILSVLLCIYFTHKNRTEIMEILSLLRSAPSDDPDPINSEYIGHKLILSYADNMAQKFAAYEARLREVHASQKNSVLERLVRNAYRSNSEKMSAVESLGLSFNGERCIALCVQFDDADTAYMITRDLSARDMIANLLETHVGTEMEVFDNLSNEVVAIVSVEEPFADTTDNIVSLLNVHI
ncbi:MAG: cache domain-containing protein, partial [Oscillospiraceae bacterium]|nr:cache domain-containing protein [Oscillospiraceae bacterium]